MVLPEMAVFSGDTVRRDEEGFLYFVGRRDEMIKTSGYRISPTEIEEVLYATGLVGECAAFGVPIIRRSAKSIVVMATPPAATVLDVEHADRRAAATASAGLHGPGENRGARRARCRAIPTARSIASRSPRSYGETRRALRA